MKLLKGAMLFFSGVAVGSICSYMFFKKQYDEQKEALDVLKEHYMCKIEDNVDKKIMEDIIEKEEYVSYNKIKDKKTKESIGNDELIVTKTKTSKESSPIIITEEEYSEQELYFEKLEVDYYLDDGALVDENEDLLVIDDTIGYDNLESFISNESENIIYIRNSKQTTDYMVHKVSGKYSDVIGVGGDDTED